MMKKSFAELRTLQETLKAAGPALPPEQPVIGSQTEPSPPNMAEIIADRFIKYGDVGAKALEELGDAAVADAGTFRVEMYRNASLLREKAQNKAMDTSWFIQQMRAFHDLAKEEPVLKAQVAPTNPTSGDGTDISHDAGNGANLPVLPNGEGHKSEV